MVEDWLLQEWEKETREQGELREKPVYRLIDEVRRLRAAIETVLADAESQHPGGWGPDVTMVAVLKDALSS